MFNAGIAKIFGKDPETELANDLRRLKQLLEAGEIATTEGQPRGGFDRQRRRQPRETNMAMRFEYLTERDHSASSAAFGVISTTVLQQLLRHRLVLGKGEQS